MRSRSLSLKFPATIKVQRNYTRKYEFSFSFHLTRESLKVSYCGVSFEGLLASRVKMLQNNEIDRW